jgi:hypothetical protein
VVMVVAEGKQHRDRPAGQGRLRHHRTGTLWRRLGCRARAVPRSGHCSGRGHRLSLRNLAVPAGAAGGRYGAAQVARIRWALRDSVTSGPDPVGNEFCVVRPKGNAHLMRLSTKNRRQTLSGAIEDVRGEACRGLGQACLRPE